MTTAISADNMADPDYVMKTIVGAAPVSKNPIDKMIEGMFELTDTDERAAAARNIATQLTGCQVNGRSAIRELDVRRNSLGKLLLCVDKPDHIWKLYRGIVDRHIADDERRCDGGEGYPASFGLDKWEDDVLDQLIAAVKGPPGSVRALCAAALVLTDGRSDYDVLLGCAEVVGARLRRCGAREPDVELFADHAACVPQIGGRRDPSVKIGRVEYPDLMAADEVHIIPTYVLKKADSKAAAVLEDLLGFVFSPKWRYIRSFAIRRPHINGLNQYGEAAVDLGASASALIEKLPNSWALSWRFLLADDRLESDQPVSSTAAARVLSDVGWCLSRAARRPEVISRCVVNDGNGAGREIHIGESTGRQRSWEYGTDLAWMLAKMAVFVDDATLADKRFDASMTNNLSMAWFLMTSPHARTSYDNTHRGDCYDSGYPTYSVVGLDGRTYRHRVEDRSVGYESLAMDSSDSGDLWNRLVAMSNDSPIALMDFAVRGLLSVGSSGPGGIDSSSSEEMLGTMHAYWGLTGILRDRVSEVDPKSLRGDSGIPEGLRPMWMPEAVTGLEAARDASARWARKMLDVRQAAIDAIEDGLAGRMSLEQFFEKAPGVLTYLEEVPGWDSDEGTIGDLVEAMCERAAGSDDTGS